MSNTEKVSAFLLSQRYLQPNEDADGLWRRVAHATALAETEWNKREVADVEEEFYQLLSTRHFLPNSPTLFNAGLSPQMLSACFVLNIEDDMAAILDTNKHAGMVWKAGGGTGFDFSKIRPEGSVVSSTQGVASGPISFMIGIDAWAQVVKQGGRRRAANMGLLACDHPDIIKFIECKDSGGLDSFNLSIAITNKFMKAVVEDKTWELISPLDNKVVSTLPAKTLFNKIAKHSWKTGDPGVIFIDKINEQNKTPHLGKITAVNPCLSGDTWIVTKNGQRQIKDVLGKSLLISVDKEWKRTSGFFSTGKKETFTIETEEGLTIKATAEHRFLTQDWAWLKVKDMQQGDILRLSRRYASLTTSATITNISPYGVEEVYNANVEELNAFDANEFIVHNCGEQPLKANDSCTLGSINLYQLHKDYDSVFDGIKKVLPTAIRFLDNIVEINEYPFDFIREQTRKTRNLGLGIMGFADLLYDMKITYGSAESIDLGYHIMKEVDKIASSASQKLVKERGVFPAYEGSVYDELGIPIRNANRTTIAPTGSISMIAGCSSGIEPVFALVYDRIMLDEVITVINPVFESYIKEHLSEEDVIVFINALKNKKTLKDPSLQKWVDKLPEDTCKIFVTTEDVLPEQHVDMQVAFQQNTNSAISKTVNLPYTASVEDIESVYMKAWKGGCKGITIFRDGCRKDQVLGVDKFIHPRPRVRVTQGNRIKYATGCGNLYVSVGSDEDGLCEVFGSTGKRGGCPSQTEAVGRLISLALRCNVSPDDIAKQLKGIRCLSTLAKRNSEGGCEVLSCPDAIARAIMEVGAGSENGEKQTARLFKEGVSESQVDGACPVCGRDVIPQDGCVVCLSCGYSKCG